MSQQVPFKQYTMFDIHVLEYNIIYWENAISYPEELVGFINELDQQPESYTRIPKWASWHASNDVDTIYGTEKFIEVANLKKPTGNNAIDMKTLYVVNSLTMAVEMCAQRFAEAKQMDKSEIKLDLRNIPLKKYNTGQGMGPHYDGQDGDTNLRYSMVTYLNDDYEGGELHFRNQNITIKPKAGSLVLFPSQQPYEHESKPVTKGEKYMFTSHWFN